MEIYDHNTLHKQHTPTPQGKRDTLKIVLAVLCAVLAVALTAVSICLAFVRNDRPAQAEDYESAFAKVRPSVAVVRASAVGAEQAGSGVVYKICGGVTYVITNHHVIADAASVRLTFTENGTPQAGEVLGYDEYHDIALIKTEGAFGEAVTAADVPAVGTRILSVGNSLDAGIAAFDGIVSHNDRALGHGDKTVPVYAVTSPVNAGMSGGGVFTLGGKIIGIGTYQTSSVVDNGETRPVDGMSYCVPFTLAEKIVERILTEESSGQVNKLSVLFDTVIDDDIIFEDLHFSARRLPKGYTVDHDVASSEMTDVLQEGDVIVQFGSLTVDAQTPFRAFFEEALRYARGDAYSNNERLKVSVLRGTTQITTEFKYVHKTV